MKILLIFMLFCGVSMAEFFDDLNASSENSENSKQSVNIPTH